MTKQHHPGHRANSGRIWAGIIIVAIGIILLADKLDIDWLIPRWLISWPMLLIVIGLIIGGKSNFKRPSAFILIAIGVFFLIQRFTGFNITPFLWPLLIIGVGLWILLDKRGSRSPLGSGPAPENGPSHGFEWDKRVHTDFPDDDPPPHAAEQQNATGNLHSDKANPSPGNEETHRSSEAGATAVDFT